MIKKNILLILALLTLLPLLPSCKKDSSGSTFLPEIIGRNGEILVVINDRLKNDTVGGYLRYMLGDVFVGLPADEPIFSMLTVPPSYFDNNMHKFRNLIFVNVADTVSQDTISFYKDMWAKNQAIVSINAKKSSAIPHMLTANDYSQHIKIISFFTKMERERLMSYYARIKSVSALNDLQKKWNLSLNIPNQFVKCTPENPNALSWYMCDTKEFQDGIFVYTFPYESEKSMSKLYLLNKRDSLLRTNIGGPQGSVMCTETAYGLDELIYKFGPRMYEGNDVAEIRGLWRMDGYAMGGPFLMRAVHDKDNNRVIVTDGYVYYPMREQKRNHIRQLEAIMYSLKTK